MLSFSALVSFIGASILLTIAPGPDNLFVVAQSVSHGRKAGIATALGLCSGITVHTMAAALGISAILYQSDLAFRLMKYIGALYLIYLACQAIKERNVMAIEDKVEKQTGFSLYRRGIFMNVLNPKVALFFLAFLPQFVQPQNGNIPGQFVLLGLIFMLQAVIIMTGIAVCSGSFGRKFLNQPRVAGCINLLKASIFAVIGIRLALAER
ncbi:Lysine exporter protein (LYSE/YGGA) [Syntrophobotulus glycolicus DSM 8271]|uniref:Lysine exporter protein (LYSE/YGGA) n=1 Tax=Syntrophobotulus glycolicus (strain DSM 8271 / FlGlyR) TaxID=645991 RepID=F0SXQ2_SYNGF|nr:LysE family translocator [Syntrophobotulus glycolicus]ADY55885.1 Lysine exporter protein (LYSE/YGGA) [Syntrophobotulus glycolicus DSM 8271]